MPLWIPIVGTLVLLIAYFLRRGSLNSPKVDLAEEGIGPTAHRIRTNVRAILSRSHPSASVSTVDGTPFDRRYFCVTVNVPTDRERDEIRTDAFLKIKFRQALVDADYPVTEIDRVGWDVQSQQTVDRDFGGDWHQARS